eukprot:m.130664 g.130664  ORF g.130664 m.130664 type:complete len:400 (+) comp52355_c0_seq1:1-1200(+)
MTATDADFLSVYSTVSFTLTSGANGFFSVAGSGAIRVAVDLDFESQSAFTLQVAAFDGLFTVQQPVSISIVQMPLTLKSFGLDLTRGTLTLSFSRTVSGQSLVPASFTLQDAPTATTFFTITGGSTPSANARSIPLTLLPEDLEAIIRTPVLAKAKASTFLTFLADAISDTQGTGIAALLDGFGFPAASFAGLPALAFTEISTGISDSISPELYIGEQVIAALSVTLAETRTSVFLRVTLPAAGSSLFFEIGSTLAVTLISVGSNLAPAAATAISPTIHQAGSTLLVDLGSIVNSPDGVTNGADELLLHLSLLVADAPELLEGSSWTLTTSLEYDAGSLPAASVEFNIRLPSVGVSKAVDDSAIVDAGDVMSFSIVAYPLGASAATAYELTLTESHEKI